jgi:hypothetical protein
VVTQAGTASVLIATIQPPKGLYSALAAQRFVDVLIGGSVGLVISIALPRSLGAATREAVGPLLAELAATLEDVALALERHDGSAAEQALERARALDPYARILQQTLDLAEETSRLSPVYRRKRAGIHAQVAAAAQLELAVRDTRVLARSAVRAVELEPTAPPGLVRAIRDLAAAVGHMDALFTSSGDGEQARAEALRAAGRATIAIEQGGSLANSALVAQVRSTATDLLQGLGLEHATAVERVRGAAGVLRAQAQVYEGAAGSE